MVTRSILKMTFGPNIIVQPVAQSYNLKATFSTKESMLRWLYFRESVQDNRLLYTNNTFKVVR